MSPKVFTEVTIQDFPIRGKAGRMAKKNLQV